MTHHDLLKEKRTLPLGGNLHAIVYDLEEAVLYDEWLNRSRERRFGFAADDEDSDALPSPHLDGITPSAIGTRRVSKTLNEGPYR